MHSFLTIRYFEQSGRLLSYGKLFRNKYRYKMFQTKQYEKLTRSVSRIHCRDRNSDSACSEEGDRELWNVRDNHAHHVTLLRAHPQEGRPELSRHALNMIKLTFESIRIEVIWNKYFGICAWNIKEAQNVLWPLHMNFERGVECQKVMSDKIYNLMSPHLKLP